MGNPFLFADRFSGAVVHLTTDGLSMGLSAPAVFTAKQNHTNSKKQKMPATV